MPLHKYIYGRPVKNDDFIGRYDALSTIFNRLNNRESTSVIGEPHIGKTSLLLQIAEPDIQRKYLGNQAERLIMSFLDLLSIDTEFNPAEFWQKALVPLAENPGQSAISKLLQRVEESNYDSDVLERLFKKLHKSGRHFVLLLDEFDRLLAHPNFKEPWFFASLRALSTHSDGLSFITATRSSVEEMNARGRGLLDTGSPFFNNVTAIHLKPFDDVEIQLIFARAGEPLPDHECKFIRRVAGGHPFLLQAMCAAVIETNGQSAKRCIKASETFFERISFHFDDLWIAMDDELRTTAVILSLVELGGRALGKDFAFGEIEQVEKFGPELRKLSSRGLAMKVGEGWSFDPESFLIWQGEKWTVGTQAFAWWVRDVVIAETRKVPAYDLWLKNKQYIIMLTKEQWDWLRNIVRGAPGWAVRGIAVLARQLLEEIIK